MGLTDQIVSIEQRVSALETDSFDADETSSVPTIIKAYGYYKTHPIYCSNLIYSKSDLYIADTAEGTANVLISAVTAIAIGTGTTPEQEDTTLSGEVLRKVPIDSFFDVDTGIAETFFDEDDANNYTITNIGAFWNNTKLIAVGSCNLEKNSSVTITADAEVKIEEV